jgi:pimeloyl-ACP methyl ester carboxylesterase
MSTAFLPGIASSIAQTARLVTHVLVRPAVGAAQGTVVFLHGNASAARFWEDTMLTVPSQLVALAPDLRGFGRSEAKAIDATRGLRDFSDDLHALLSDPARAPGKLHLVGWSVGGGVAMQYAIDHAERVASVTLVAPMSPYGFGGTKDPAGTPCAPDFAGSGGGTANPEFVRRIGAADRGEDSDFSPRKVMNQYYFKPPFRAAGPREEVFVDEVLATSTAPGCYPGDLVPSPNWPGIAPGKLGMNNAISPAYCDLSAFAAIRPRPPVLWIRGADDQIVSDTSLFDLGFLGKLGAVPGWPGDEAYPPQPMIAQVRAVLERYRAAGGSYREEVFADCGHSPHIEQAAAFAKAFVGFLSER